MRTILLSLVLLATPVLAGPLDEAEGLFELGEYKQAADVLSPALADDKTRPEALLLLTKIYNRLEDYKKGVDYGEQAIEALPESSEAHRHYAIALRIKMQKVSKFKAMFIVGSYKKQLARAIELDPNNSGARAEEIGFLIHAPGMAGGSKSKARERIEELKPIDWREAMLMQAELQNAEEDGEGLLATYHEMIARDPEDNSAREGLAFVLQAGGRYRDADEHFATLLDSDDERRSLMARYQLARSRILGEYEGEEAVSYLLDYIEQLAEPVRGVPSQSSAYWRLGMAYEQLNRIEDARQAYRKAIDLDGENKLARTALKGLG